MEYKSILLATDFSDRSLPAERTALMLARQSDAALCVVHAVEPIMGGEGDDVDAEFDEFYDRLRQRAQDAMEVRLAQWADHHITIKQHIQIGERWKVVLECAESERADVIVLGRRAYRPGDRVPLGTTSQKIFFATNRPVLFVPLDD